MRARLLRHLLRQDGIALIMALGVMLTLTVAGTAAFTYTTSNSRSSEHSKASGRAYALAEAGVAQALSVLSQATNPVDPNLLPTTVFPFEGGSATYSGALTGTVWTITSRGKVANPVNLSPSDVSRTLTRQVNVHSLDVGLISGYWDRIYHHNNTSCFTIPVAIPSSVSARGNMCLNFPGTITGSSTKVEVGGNVTLNGLATSSQRDAGSGSGWTNSGNIVSSDNLDASTSVGASGGTSANLDAKTFGFAIPAGATITGITARVERAASASSAISDFDVYLLKAGAQAGTDHAAGGTWGTGDATQTYGTSTDLWGTTWTVADINDANFGLRVKVTNSSGASVTAYVDNVDITVYYTTAPASIGSSGSPVAQVDVAGTCKAGANPANSPCSPADSVFASTITTSPQNLVKPTVDFAYWYANAKPGPMQSCTTGSFPGGFDTNGTYDMSRAAAEITPTASSYTCEVRDAGNNLIGELSWNHVTHVLKVKGTIFIDTTELSFRDDDQLVNYQGRGTIYVPGEWHNDEVICAGGTGSTNCRTAGMSSWSPETNMLVLIAGALKPSANKDVLMHKAAAFQGVLYAVHDCEIGADDEGGAYSSGPIICERVQITSEDGFYPSFFAWPPMPPSSQGQLYTNGATNAFQLVLGPQSG